jgi:hypothetical protein
MADKIHVIVTTSPNYESVYKFFHDSITTEPSIELHINNIDLSSYSSRDFRSDGWYAALHHKIQYLVEFLKSHSEIPHVVFSDADIQYFRPAGLYELIQQLYEKNLDYYGMQETDTADYNTGFFIIKNTPQIIALFESVSNRLLSERPPFGDQTLINDYITENTYNIAHAHIPRKYCIFGDNSPESPYVIFHHAVNTSNTNGKTEQLAAVKDRYMSYMSNQKSEGFRTNVDQFILIGIIVCAVLISLLYFINNVGTIKHQYNIIAKSVGRVLKHII